MISSNLYHPSHLSCRCPCPASPRPPSLSSPSGDGHGRRPRVRNAVLTRSSAYQGPFTGGDPSSCRSRRGSWGQRWCPMSTLSPANKDRVWELMPRYSWFWPILSPEMKLAIILERWRTKNQVSAITGFHSAFLKVKSSDVGNMDAGMTMKTENQ